MPRKLTGVYRQRRGGLTIYKPKDENTVTRVDFNGSFEEIGRFNFNTSEDGGSQAFLKRMLTQGFRNCIVRQKGTDNAVDSRRKRVSSRKLGKGSTNND